MVSHFFSRPASPVQADPLNQESYTTGNSGGHILSQAMQDRHDSVVIEPPPGRPHAPAPAVISPPKAAHSPASTFTLGPERPLKLFKLEDFEFLKILGT